MARKRRRKGGISRAFNWTFGLAIVLGLFFIAWQRDLLRVPHALLDPSSQAAFAQWLAEDTARATQFAALEAFLTEHGVAEVVPAWQLARVEEAYAKRCNLDHWQLPPRELWPNVVPALQLVRDHVIPTVGAVEVQSSYRTPEINTCAGGAARSRHMRFQALDLLAVDRPDDHAQFYGTLCAMQSRAGQGSAMGLGAYFDGSDPFYNPNARFHIDGAGFRSWGRSYTAATSPCPQR